MSKHFRQEDIEEIRAEELAEQRAASAGNSRADRRAAKEAARQEKLLRKAQAKTGRSFPGKIVRFFVTLLIIAVLLAGALIGFLSVTEYKPSDIEPEPVMGIGSKPLSRGDDFEVITWNIGYGALGDNADFFMDGGEMVATADRERVIGNMRGVMAQLRESDPDVIFLQEVDRDSNRSRRLDELSFLTDELKGYSSSFATNFKVAFLPYPVPPIGKVDSGIAAFSKYQIESSERVQLPIPFKWPVRMANLKRCVLVSRVPIKDSKMELVLFDLHLEAYDDGTGKAEQTKMLAELLKAETEKGNCVIAGGDFNQIFSTEDKSIYPHQEGKWQAGEIDVSAFGGNFKFLMDEKTPTCRSLDQPYAGADKETFQYYLIDGFIVSDNIKVLEYETMDLDFVSSDHNPVRMKVRIK